MSRITYASIEGRNDAQVFYVFVDLIAINRLFIIRQYREREMHRFRGAGGGSVKREKGIEYQKRMNQGRECYLFARICLPVLIK